MPIRSFTNQDVAITPDLDAFGRVYSFDFQPSAGETSSTLFINIVNNKGDYDVDFLKGAMSYLTYFKFDILGGELKGGITLYAFLVGYTQSISNQSKTLRLEFKDGCHILDRIYVALLNKELKRNNQNSVPELKTFTKKIFCETCNQNENPAGERFSVKTLDQQRIIHDASSLLSRTVQGENIYGNQIDGGVILVGKEKYTRTSCDIPDCDYNFTELKNAAEKIGVFIKIPDIFPFYRVSDSGTLKEKLAHFCSKFGFGFRYDFSRDPSFGHYIYPTETPFENDSVYKKLEELKIFATGFKSPNQTDPVVINITDEESIDSTEKRFTSVLVKKNGEYQEKTKTVNYQAVLNPIKLRDIMKFNTDHTGFRSEEELISSSVIAKYNKVARMLYNIALSESGKKPKALIPLGFVPLVQLKADEEKIQFIMKRVTSVASELKKALIKWQVFYEDNALVPWGVTGSKFPLKITLNPETFDVYIGVHSEENEKKYEKMEADIVKFLGKYYFNFIAAEEVEHFSYTSLMHGTASVKLTPESTQYSISKKICHEVEPKAEQSSTNISAISSHDGEIVSAVENTGRNLNSKDSGKKWAKDNLPGDKPWTCVASSETGEYVFSASSGGGIYSSSDSGKTWICCHEDSLPWTSIACSSDGTRVFAVNSSESKYYASLDHGTTWMVTDQEGPASSVICSADGKEMMAVTIKGSFFASWKQQSFPVLEAAGISNIEPITCAACSDDGKTVFLSVAKGHIYRSKESGHVDKWEPTNSPDEKWSSVSCSSDGKKVTALTWEGNLYLSFDSGFSWVLQEEIKGWRAVIVSRNGEKILGSTLDKKFHSLRFPEKTADGSVGEVLFKNASSISIGGSNISIAESTGNISTSKDLGKTWSKFMGDALDLNWVDIACSSSGKFIFSVHDALNTPVHFSLDSGDTWVPLFDFMANPSATMRGWVVDGVMIEGLAPDKMRKLQSITCSSDGTRAYAVDALTGFLFFWTLPGVADGADVAKISGFHLQGRIVDPNIEPTDPKEPKPCTSIACSDNGLVIIISTSSGQIYERNFTRHEDPEFANRFLFATTKKAMGSITCVACSGDGQLLFFTVEGGFIYRKESINFLPAFWTETDSSKQTWVSISCSTSGKEAIALTQEGRLYVSSDFGNKWVLQARPKKWKVAKISKDGTTIVGTALDGRLFSVPFADEVPPPDTKRTGPLSIEEILRKKPKIECKVDGCSGSPLPFADIMDGGILPDGSKLLSPTDNKITIHERSAVFSGDDEFITDFLKKVMHKVETVECDRSNEEIEELSNPLDIFKPLFYKLTGAVSNYDVTTLDMKDIMNRFIDSPFLAPSAQSSVGVVPTEDKDKERVINFSCLIVPSQKLIDRLFKISPIHSRQNIKDKTWHEEVDKRKMEEIDASANFCKVQEDPSSESDVKEIKDPVTGRFFANPCYCKSSPFSGETDVFNPSKKPHITGLKSNIAAGFVIQLGKVFGKSHYVLISENENLSEGELQVTFPCGTLLKDSILEEYAANFSETIARTMFYYPFIKTYNNFESKINAAKINVSHEDLSGLVYREFADPKVFSNFMNGEGQIMDVPLEIEDPEKGGFVGLSAYFDIMREIEEKSSMLLARKKLTITLAATDSLGDFLKYLKTEEGFSSITIEKSNDVLNLTLSFENKPPKKFDMFREISSAAKIGREF